MKVTSLWMCGLAAVLVMAGLLYAIFGPTVTTRTETDAPTGESRSEQSTRSLFTDGIEPGTWAFIGLVAVSAAGLGSAALAGAFGSNRAAPRAALIASATLLVLAAVSGFTIGWLFLPGALLGVVGAALWKR